MKHLKKKIGALKTKGQLDSRSSLLSLTPFVDDDGILRLGGRLEKTTISYNQKHPILLPKNEKLTKLIARQYHVANLHCGAQQLLYSMRQKYWPLSGRISRDSFN